MSLYLPLTAISYKRLVSRLRTLNEQTLTSLYVFIEGSFSHRRSACAV